ncbi:MAG: hypothetical protein NZM12_06515 [Steroidobacteraceae bacterium]|nr:hypothetical protein [Steroidobacteraceae bacterium]
MGDAEPLVFVGAADQQDLTLIIELRPAGEVHGELRGLPQVLELRGAAVNARIEGVLIGLDDVLTFAAELRDDSVHLLIEARDAPALLSGVLDCNLRKL